MVEDAVDQKDNVVLLGRARDVAARGRGKIENVFAGDAILERKRRTGENR